MDKIINCCLHEMNSLFHFLLFFLFINSILACEVNDGYTDPYIGRVDLDPSEYCDPRNLRSIKGVTCCSPERPSKSFPSFYLYINGPSHYTRMLDWTNRADGIHIPKNGKVYILLHGYPYSPRNSSWVRLTAGLLNRRGIAAVAVDYSTALEYSDRYATLSNFRTVGKVVAYAIKNWVLKDIAKVVGFSFGGTALGETAKAAQELFGYKIKECIGLDIGNLGVDGGSPSLRLTRDSCQLVQVIHTSSAYAPDAIESQFTTFVGTYWKSGHCDWWINCGHEQPNCRFATLNENLVVNGFNPVGSDGDTTFRPNFCYHFQSPQVWTAALAQRCQFYGIPCESCGGKECKYSDSNSVIPFLKCDPSMNVDFVVKTSNFPYC